MFLCDEERRAKRWAVLISIVIPVHNEVHNIGKLIEEVSMLSVIYPYEIIIVDDGSDDDTPAVLSKIKTKMPPLKVIRHREKYGQSAAIATGVAKADGEVIVTIDGDGQNDPSDIPKMLSLLLDNETYQMVVGTRKRRKDSSWRIITSQIANSARSFLLKDNISDTGCGLKTFYKSVFTSLPFFDHMHRFLPALVQMQGNRVASIEVNHRPRAEGTSHYRTLDRLSAGLVDLMGVYWLKRRSSKALVRKAIDD